MYKDERKPVFNNFKDYGITPERIHDFFRLTKSTPKDLWAWLRRTKSVRFPCQMELYMGKFLLESGEQEPMYVRKPCTPGEKNMEDGAGNKAESIIITIYIMWIFRQDYIFCPSFRTKFQKYVRRVYDGKEK